MWWMTNVRNVPGEDWLTFYRRCHHRAKDFRGGAIPSLWHTAVRTSHGWHGHLHRHPTTPTAIVRAWMCLTWWRMVQHVRDHRGPPSATPIADSTVPSNVFLSFVSATLFPLGLQTEPDGPSRAPFFCDGVYRRSEARFRLLRPRSGRRASWLTAPSLFKGTGFRGAFVAVGEVRGLFSISRLRWR